MSALDDLCRSKPELEELLDRLADLAPVVRQQRRDTWRKAERAYFEESGRASPEGLAMWRATGVIMGGDFIRIECSRGPDTPEQEEFRSIGLAVAAFGGAEAISAIGWELDERKCSAPHTVWHEWDGMAGHWL